MAQSRSQGKPTTPAVTSTTLRLQLADVLGRAEFSGGRTVITRRGKVIAAVVSAADLAELEKSRAA